MSKYISIDTEATGIEEGTYLIQLAFVPVDTKENKVYEALGKEVLVKCPSFESLKPTLNEWVISHNEGLIRQAHSEGIRADQVPAFVAGYMESAPVRAIFGSDRPPFLGKSLSALDIPLLTRYLGKEFLTKYFHHHTADVTCLARAMVDAGKLPPGCESTSHLLKHLGIRDDAKHTALSDAVDMANAYLALLKLL